MRLNYLFTFLPKQTRKNSPPKKRSKGPRTHTHTHTSACLGHIALSATKLRERTNWLQGIFPPTAPRHHPPLIYAPIRGSSNASASLHVLVFLVLIFSLSTHYKLVKTAHNWKLQTKQRRQDGNGGGRVTWHPDELNLRESIEDNVQIASAG